MRFMIIVKASKDSEAGIMLAGEGLRPSSKGARVRCAGDKAVAAVAA